MTGRVTQATTPVAARETSDLPGAVIIARIRRLLVVAIIAGVAYTTLMHAQKSGCSTGGAGDLAAERCIELRILPGPLVVVAIVAVVLLALGRVLRAAVLEADALRILDRAALLIAVLAAGSLLIGFTWFALMPIPDPSTSFSVVFPFPFASGDVTTTP